MSLPSHWVRVSAAAFGLFTLVCRDINTLVCFHINSDVSKAVCGAESLTILKKAKQTLNVIMDVVKIRNRSKWKCGEWVQVEIEAEPIFSPCLHLLLWKESLGCVWNTHSRFGAGLSLTAVSNGPHRAKWRLTTEIYIFSLLEHKYFGFRKRRLQCIWCQGHQFEIEKRRLHVLLHGYKDMSSNSVSQPWFSPGSDPAGCLQQI